MKPLAFRLLLDTLRAWSWSHTRWALFVGAATLFANGTPLQHFEQDVRVWHALAYNILQFGFPLVLLLGWAHRLVDLQLLRPGIAYPLVVLVEVPVGVLVIGPALMPLLGSVSWWTVWNDIVLISSTLVWHALGVAVVAQRHLNQRAEARRREAERQHAERQRELAATELLALQARVDPPLLFERLQTIGTELAQQPAQARRRLEALIDLLRALQPHAQARVSTLGREIDALEAYARLGSREAKGTERLLIHLPEPMRELAMAPLVLLPLLRPLLAAPGLIWQLRGETRPNGKAVLSLAGLGPGPAELRAAASQVDLPLLRQRLVAVFGPGATLSLDDENLPFFTLQWPPLPF